MSVVTKLCIGILLHHNNRHFKHDVCVCWYVFIGVLVWYQWIERVFKFERISSAPSYSCTRSYNYL